MKIAGFTFLKINVERLKDSSEEIKINTNIDISEIAELKSDIFKSNDELIGVRFVHKVDYEPEVAKLEVVGNIIIALDPKIAKEVIEEWKKNKKLSDDFRIPLFNIILKKCSLKLLDLEDEMGLPLHLPLPVFRKENLESK